MDPFVPYVVMFTVIVLGLLYLGLRAHQARNLHQERLAAIEKGLDIKPIVVGAGMTPAFAHRVYLLRGIVWMATGLALAAVLAALVPFLDDAPNAQAQLESKLLRANTLKNIGATDAQIAAMETEIARQAHRRPDKMLLCVLGLLPAAVGAAYLIFYALEEKRVRALTPP